MSAQLVTVGRVGAPHGIGGALRLQLFLEDPNQVFQFKAWHFHFPEKTDFVPFHDFTLQEKGAQIYIAFNAIKDRDQARQFTHTLLAVPRTELSVLGPDEFYWSDLEGLAVYNQSGKFFGVVDHLLATGANDVLVVKVPGNEEILIPYVYPHIVIKVSLRDAKIIVDWE